MYIFGQLIQWQACHDSDRDGVGDCLVDRLCWGSPSDEIWIYQEGVGDDTTFRIEIGEMEMNSGIKSLNAAKEIAVKLWIGRA